MDVREFKKLPVLGIIRGIDEEAVEPLAEAIIASGLKTIEITMNTAGAAKLIKHMKKTAGNKLTIGAGTVLTKKSCDIALDAGASFIVLPTLIHEVVKPCVDKKIPVFPGAFTPQEVYNAWEAKATMVKVFPSKFLGPGYIKELKGPFDKIELLACGGVGPDNIRAFFDSGASAVAFGASIFEKEWMKKGQYKRITESIDSLLSKWREG